MTLCTNSKWARKREKRLKKGTELVDKELTERKRLKIRVGNQLRNQPCSLRPIPVDTLQMTTRNPWRDLPSRESNYTVLLLGYAYGIRTTDMLGCIEVKIRLIKFVQRFHSVEIVKCWYDSSINIFDFYFYFRNCSELSNYL